MKKRVLSILSCLVAVTLLTVGCSSTGEQSSNKEQENNQQAVKEEKPKSDLKVAMVTSAGGLGDRSYNDSGYEGLKKVNEEFGIEIKVVEPNDVSEGEKYLSELAKAGYNLVMTFEYGHADVLNRVAPMYPETQFVIFNTTVDQPNVTSVLFKEHEGSFLAGALAAMVTSDTTIEKVNPDKVISVIGGTESPGIDKFIVGFEEGAHYIDKDVQVISGYSNSFSDPTKGKEIALSQITQKSDIVYQVAGGTGEGIFAAAKEKDVFAIGVDSDQDYIAPGNILTSVMKRMDKAVVMLAKQLQDGTLGQERIIELGLQDGIELSPMEYTKGLIPTKYLEKVGEIQDQIMAGTIKVTDVSKQ